jgi:hypothetical protein
MPTVAFDDRIIQVVFTYGQTEVTIDTRDGDPGRPIDISANGSLYVNPLQNECNITIANLSRDLRNQLQTQLTPFNLDQARKTVKLYAGRESTGLFLLYQGDITEGMSTQPPDIFTNIKSKTNQFYKYNIIAQAQNITAPLSQIVSNAASGMGLNARFEATDKQIANYSYTGAQIKEIDHISELGPYDVYTTGNTLVCKNKNVPLQNENHTVSMATGMIGQPQPTEWGCKVVTMLNPSIMIGGGFTLQSLINPLLDGDYTIYKYGFQIASRDVPFYSIMEGTKRYDLYTNTALPQA